MSLSAYLTEICASFYKHNLFIGLLVKSLVTSELTQVTQNAYEKDDQKVMRQFLCHSELPLSSFSEGNLFKDDAQKNC